MFLSTILGQIGLVEMENVVHEGDEVALGFQPLIRGCKTRTVGKVYHFACRKCRRVVTPRKSGPRKACNPLPWSLASSQIVTIA
jgi:hypothetical protein